ncbi:hypothetical protein [Paraburkholderia sp.]|uniref:hypothetical protein n=1 Tax=Paraburkholderia sp. TaxID=1926495 RepID=UPI0039E621CC
MRTIADFAVSASPPLMVSIVFWIAYLLVGIPVHFARGAVSRDVFGTLAGVFAALIYLTMVLSFPSHPLR